MIRCVICTAAFVIDKDKSQKNIKCKQCNEFVIKCFKCKNIPINTCFQHTIRQHLCLSKCLHECVLNKIPVSKKQKITKKRKIEIKHQPTIGF